MTIELLEKRKQELLVTQQQLLSQYQQLVTQSQQAQASANAVNGAIQDCEYWLGVLRAPAVETAQQ